MSQPESLGKYRIDGVLGHGAMGTVYKGYDASIDRAVAIKTVHPHLLTGTHGRELRQRFIREARAAARCSHPNIVSIFELGDDGETPFIVMELIEGRELSEHLAGRARFPIEKTVETLLQVLSALQFAHASGVVHRDIKPANIILLDDGRVKVADFGVAHIVAHQMTQPGFVIGTPGYMSPEQLTCGPCDARSDLYSVGVVLCELLTGRRPPPVMAPAPGNGGFTPYPPADLIVQIPDPFRPVVRRATAAHPEDRFQTGEAFAAALQAALGGYRGDGPPPVASGTVILSPANADSALPTAPPTGGWNPADLEAVERALVLHLGPMAGLVVRKAAQQAANLEALYRSVARHIPSDAERDLFLNKVRAPGTGDSSVSTGGASSASGIAPVANAAIDRRPHVSLSREELQSASDSLITYVGPLATVLVNKAAQRATDVEEFYRLLAEYIPNAEERTSFLRRRGRAD
jgi:serine/threonine-protein kinase